MAERTNVAKVALVNKTTAEWAAETKIPFRGCACVEFTTDGKTKLKIGDGTNLYTSLPYVADELTAALIIAALGYTPLDSAKLGVAENRQCSRNRGTWKDLCGHAHKQNLQMERNGIH